MVKLLSEDGLHTQHGIGTLGSMVKKRVLFSSKKGLVMVYPLRFVKNFDGYRSFWVFVYVRGRKHVEV